MSRLFTHNGCKAIEFNGMVDHVEFLESNNGSRHHHLKAMAREGDFFGCDNYEELITKMKYGDSKATASLLDKLKSSQVYSDIDNGVKMDIDGFAYDMGSVVSGEPECCLSSGSPQAKPYIKIFVDQGYSGHTDVDVINNRSVGIVNLVTSLQTMGYVVELVVGNYERGTKIYGFTKLSTDSLCVSQIAVATSPYYWRCGSWMTTMMLGKTTDTGHSLMDYSDIEAMEKEGWFYIGGGYTDSKMNSLSTGDDGTEYITELFNKYCSTRGLKKEICMV